MAYSNKNHIAKRARAYETALLHYEPGRQDRCMRWVWQKYIRDEFHIEYQTFMGWLREHRAWIEESRAKVQREYDSKQPTLFDL